MKIQAWCDYEGVTLTSFEKSLILDMDRVFIQTWREENAKVQQAKLEASKTKNKYE